MTSKIKSSRCGYGKCIHYDKHNTVSACKVYEDRNQCSKSLGRRKKVAKVSRLKQKEL